MRRHPLPNSSNTLFFLLLSLISAAYAVAEDPWADRIIAYNAIDPNTGFNTPEKTLGEPVGGGIYAPNNSSLHSIGRPGPAPGSYLLLAFNTPVTDDPENPMGLDCIVYGNASWVGGNPNRKWIEAGLIEISADANNNGLPDDPWFLIPGSRALTRSCLPLGLPNPSPPLAGNVDNENTDGTEYNWGYAELTPTQYKYLDNYVRPDDPFDVGLTPRSGGGDAFDIAWAVDDMGAPAHLTSFDFIRISAFVNAEDPAFGFITPEIDAVADVAPEIDTDRDGILDEYESRVAGTDPGRPESTVLPLEIPPEEGGSPAGALLGTAADAAGNAITLFSAGLRSGLREYNCTVDIQTIADPHPGLALSGLIKSGAVRQFSASLADFTAAQIAEAQCTIAYSASEIVGLDETALTPYRYEDGVFSQEGISGIIKSPANNTITFTSARPGIFLLASTAGDGDDDLAANAITLEANPPLAQVGDPGEWVEVRTGPIYLLDESLAPNGMLFTVATTLGNIESADADPALAGTQVAVESGSLAFSFRTGLTAGTAMLSVLSRDGLLHGELPYLLAAGPAIEPIELYRLDPHPTAPGPVSFSTSPATDAWGNALDAGAYLTIAVRGATVLNADADPETPGHQLALVNGVANFSVRVLVEDGTDRAFFDVAIYGDAEGAALLAEAQYHLDVVQMPLGNAAPWITLLLLCAAGFAAIARQRCAAS